MMDCVLSGSLLVVFSLFCYATCVFFRANKLSLSLSLLILLLPTHTAYFGNKTINM